MNASNDESCVEPLAGISTHRQRSPTDGAVMPSQILGLGSRG